MARARAENRGMQSGLGRWLGAWAVAAGVAVGALHAMPAAWGQSAPGAGEGSAMAPAAAPVIVTVDEAEFALTPAGPWTPVSLPDTWGQRGARGPGLGWYRLRLPPLALEPGVLHAMRAERMVNHRRLWLNGHLVEDTRSLAARSRPQAVAWHLALPPGLLRADQNLVEIEAAGGLRAGLSVLHVGPAAAIEAEDLSAQRWREQLPQALNAAAAGTCLFALMLWWRRRSEAAMGWFGLLGLMASLRNIAYYETGLGLSATASSALFYVVQVCTVLLLGMFAVAAAQQPAPVYRRLLAVSGLVLLTAGAAAAVLGGRTLDSLRAVAYPAFGLLVLPALWLLAVRARRLNGRALALLAATLALVFIGGVHDYLHQQGRLAITSQWWLPWATPLAVMAFTASLVGNVSRAMAQVESLNQTLESRVRARTHELAEASVAKSRFLAAIGHDLRQPVTSIAMLVRLLRDQATPAASAPLQQLDRAVVALGAQLTGLLDLALQESDGAQLRPTRVPLQPLFDRVFLAEQEGARRKGLALKARHTTLCVQAEPVLLEQVLRNLVGNAVRHTESGGVRLSARAVAGGRVRLRVLDTGPGLPLHEQAVLRGAAESASGQNQRAHDPAGLGRGLGLSIVRRAAALLQAPLQLRTQPGRGSAFTLELPAALKSSCVEPGAALDRLVTAAPWPGLGGLSLWLVLGDSVQRSALKVALSAQGARVQVCAGPRELRAALDALPLAQRQADALVTVLRPQGGNALEVAALARRRLGQLPVLALPEADEPTLARALPVLYLRAAALSRADVLLLTDREPETVVRALGQVLGR